MPNRFLTSWVWIITAQLWIISHLLARVELPAAAMVIVRIVDRRGTFLHVVLVCQIIHIHTVIGPVLTMFLWERFTLPMGRILKLDTLCHSTRISRQISATITTKVHWSGRGERDTPKIILHQFEHFYEECPWLTEIDDPHCVFTLLLFYPIEAS